MISLSVTLVLAACGGSAVSTATTDGLDDEHSEEEYRFGEPADAEGSGRTVEIEANDDFTFSPAELMVSAGEVITFRVTNTGNFPHDFTLGDQETQDAHEAEIVEMMENGGMEMHDEDNAIALAAGETKELTWRFSESGTVLVGCHQPGHYSAGMDGSVTVEP